MRAVRPELVAPLLRDPRQAVFLVPSAAFRVQPIATLPRAMRIGAGVSDPERAQHNRLERDRILQEELVAERFRPFLPDWLY